jgi:uncharacterized repeat protein (TIGR01451 family)
MKTKLYLAIIILSYSLNITSQNWEWVKSYENNTDDIYTNYEPFSQLYINNIDIDKDGNIFSVDNFAGNLNFGSTSLTSGFNRTDIFVEKMSANGDWDWAIQSNGDGVGYGTAKCIHIDDSGNSYIGFGYHGRIGFGNNSSNNYYSGGYNGLIAKFNPNGTILWTVTFNPAISDNEIFISSILTDNEGFIYVSGEYERRMVIAPRRSSKLTIDGVVGVNNSFDRDVFVAKLSPAGDPVWVVGAGNSRADYNLKMIIDKDDNLYITGKILKSYSGNTSVFGDLNVVFDDDTKYIAKLNTDGEFSWVYPLSPDKSLGLDLVVDDSGNVFCLDSFGSISKINSLGQLQWSKKISSSFPNFGTGTALGIDSSQNIYIGGNFHGNPVIGEDVLTSNDSSRDRTFFAKMDNAGNWEYAVENNNSNIEVISNSHIIRDMKVIGEDEIIVSGMSLSEDDQGYPHTKVFRGIVTISNHISDNNDLNISIYPLNEARAGFKASYRIVYNNVGTTQLDGNIKLEYEDSKIVFSNASEVIDSQTSNSITFNYSNLSPSESRIIDVNFNVFAPPIIPETGETLSFSTSIYPISGDLTENDNLYSLNQEIVNSYDPNDISVLEGSEILLEDIDEYLHYIIRFQNTGTADAINIRVTNFFDDNLDWKTFQLESSSHALNIERVYGYEVSFVFKDINLPDSTTDEPNSHGFIAYKIKPKNDVIVGDILPNKADIFFDFNSAIETNLVTTKIISSLSMDDHLIPKFHAYPNPTKGVLNIKTQLHVTKLNVYNNVGQLILSQFNKKSIDVSSLNTGLYFIKIEGVNGTLETKKFIKE